MNFPYSMIIRWSDADQVYVTHLVEFGDGARTHGVTYEEAAKNGREVLEMLIEDYLRTHQELPVPQKYEDEIDKTPLENENEPSRPRRKITGLKGDQSHATA